MTYREAFTDLIQILGQLYSDQASIRRIIIQVNLPIEQILFSGRADNTWADVLYKARRHNQVEDIFAVVLGEYPAVPELHTAVAGYRDVVAQGGLSPPPLRRCDFYAHVSLPPNFVARPALLSDVRDVLLTTPTMALTSAIPMDALHGMGGIGKSVMARALCDDPEVQAAFPDGILWATIGQTPEPIRISRLREWVEELGGIIPQTAPTINQLKQNLAELLTDRACLLILDDVWHRSDAEPFLVGGPRCRLLLTTRDSEVARGLGAAVHPVPVMDPDEALILLEQWAGGAIRQTDEAVKRQIVRRLGYLPLAIKLAGSQLQRKSPERWLAGFDATQLQERRVEKVHDSLARTFVLSLDELSSEVRRLYVALAIFREDEATPMAGIGRLWAGLAGYNEDQTVDLVQDMAARALLQIVDSAADGLPVAVVIHDLLRDFMGAELGEAGRLAAHRALVEAYRQTQVGAGWSTAPDDGYLYDHLVYHLDQLASHDASAVTDLQSLFANDAWLQVRVSGAGYRYAGYLADLDVVWQRANRETLRQIEAGEEPAAFAECMRCALIRTSVNSLARNYEPALVARAVKTGLWSAQRAFSVALRIPDPRARASMLTAMMAVVDIHFSGDLLAKGLAAALALRDGEYRAQALVALAPQLSGEEKAYALAQALAAALAIKKESQRAWALTAVAPHLSGEEKAYALAQALAAARAIENGRDRAHALAALAPQLSGNLLAECLAAALAFQHEEERCRVLAALVPQFSGDLLAQGLTAALAIQDEWRRAEVLAALAPQFSGDLLAQALAAALAIWNESYRARVLVALAPQLSGDLFAQALAAALAIHHEGYRARALAALAPQLSGDLLAQGLAAALAIEDGGDRAHALAALAPRLSGEEKVYALAQALNADQYDRARTLTALAALLSGDLLAQGLAAALAIQHSKSRAQALIALAPQLSGEEKAYALAQALAAARAILYDEQSRAQALTALAHQLSGEDKAYALTQGLAAALAIEDGGDRAHALAALVPQLSGDLLAEGLTAVLAFQDGWRRNDWRRAQALAALAPQLSGDLLAKGLASALTFQEEWSRAHALSALVPQLSEDLLAQGLAAALAIEDGGDRAHALAALASHLSGELLPQKLTAALAIEDKKKPAMATSRFVLAIQGDQPRVRDIRLAMVHNLWNNMKHKEREALLRYCSTERFRFVILEPAILSSIAASIIDICQYWIWL